MRVQQQAVLCVSSVRMAVTATLLLLRCAMATHGISVTALLQ
jgi:hypothetical protein